MVRHILCTLKERWKFKFWRLLLKRVVINFKYTFFYKTYKIYKIKIKILSENKKDFFSILKIYNENFAINKLII